MKHVGEFLKRKRLLQPPVPIYPANNPPTTSNCSGGLGVFPGIGSSLARGKEQPARGIAKSQRQKRPLELHTTIGIVSLKTTVAWFPSKGYLYSH